MFEKSNSSSVLGIPNVQGPCRGVKPEVGQGNTTRRDGTLVLNGGGTLDTQRRGRLGLRSCNDVHYPAFRSGLFRKLPQDDLHMMKVTLLTPPSYSSGGRLSRVTEQVAWGSSLASVLSMRNAIWE